MKAENEIKDIFGICGNGHEYYQELAIENGYSQETVRCPRCREVVRAIDYTPLDVGSPGTIKNRRIVRRYHDELKVVASWESLMTTLVVLLLGLIPFMLLYTILGSVSPGGKRWLAYAFLTFMGLIFESYGLWILLAFCPTRFSFNRSLGRMTRKTLWSSDSHPISDILAIQLCYGGRHNTEDSYYISCQLNVVLRDESMTRLNLAHEVDQHALCEMGERIAAHVGVPLVDQSRVRYGDNMKEYEMD